MEETPTEAELLPLFLKLAGRTVVVIGAGEIAERKVHSLLEAGALVRLVAPEATAGLRALAAASRLEFHPRRFLESDLEGAWLVFAATSDGQAQRAVSHAATARQLFCVAVDDPPNASAYSGAVVRRAPFTIAVSSRGAAPALTRLLREVLESILPPEDWVAHAQRLRERWIAQGTPMGERFAELVRDLTARSPRQ